MRRMDELIAAISVEPEAPQPESADRLERAHALVDELDEIEGPLAPYDRLRFSGHTSRDRLIDDVRKQYPHVTGPRSRVTSAELVAVGHQGDQRAAALVEAVENGPAMPTPFEDPCFCQRRQVSRGGTRR
jgi:hypothetical protein